MIPRFRADGRLPLGVHDCHWGEFVDRFGTTSHRRQLISGLKLAMEHLRQANCSTIYIGGSFVTAKIKPNDFDACWETKGVDIERLLIIAPALIHFENQRAAQKGQYSGDVYPKAQYGGDIFPDNWFLGPMTFLELLQWDRSITPKGIVRINLRSR